MNIKRFALAAIAVFIAAQISDMIIHTMILGERYMATQHIWRPDMMSMMWIMSLNYVLFVLLFVYIFTKGREGKGVIEGVRYGVIMGLIMSVFGAVNQYIVYPLPFDLMILWCVFGMIQFIIYGILTAVIYKPVEG